MSRQPLTVLVLGATGKQGGRVAHFLLEHGHHVRALTRNPDSPAAQALKARGAELFEGDLEDGGSIERAARGADAVFALSTPFEKGIEAEVRQGLTAADAAKAAGVGHFVFTSVSDADRQTGIPHFDSKFRVEQHLKAIDLPHTIIAPVFFAENISSPLFGAGLKQGTLAIPMPADRVLQQIGIDEIGRFAVLVLENRDRFLGRRINIASDELPLSRVAAILSEVIGKPIHYFPVPVEQVKAQNEDLGRMFEWFDQVGYSADVEGLRRDYPEVGWRRFEAWARAQDWSFTK